MRPIRLTAGNLAAASATNVALSQSPAAAGLLTINGAAAAAGVATLDQARQIIITSGGNDTGTTFTVTGTTRDGRVVSEALKGANAGAAGTLTDFATITSIFISAASAGTVTVGTNTVARYIIPLDWYANPTNAQMNAVVAGTITFQIDQTLDDPFAGVAPSNWFALQATGAVTVQKSMTITATAIRVNVTAETAGAGNNVAFEFVQGGGTTAS